MLDAGKAKAKGVLDCLIARGYDINEPGQTGQNLLMYVFHDTTTVIPDTVPRNREVRLISF